MKVQWQLVPVSLSHRNTKLSLSQGKHPLKPVGGGWLQFILSLLKDKEEFSLYATLGSHGSLSALLLLCQRQMEFCFLFQAILKYYFLESYSRIFFQKYYIVVFLQNCPDQEHKAMVCFLLMFSWSHSGLETELCLCRACLTKRIVWP